jgi:hypothetical protein
MHDGKLNFHSVFLDTLYNVILYMYINFSTVVSAFVRNVNNYHLFTKQCVLWTRGEAKGNNGVRGATKHTAFPRSL